MGWCPTCFTSTEQIRWHSYVAPGSDLNGLKVRCNDCLQAVPVDAAECGLRPIDRSAEVVAVFREVGPRVSLGH